MKNLITSILFVIVSVFGFSQNQKDTVNSKSDDLWYVNITPLETKNNKTKEYKEHYIFQVSHNFIYVIDKNYNIKYTMEMTNIVEFENHIVVTAKRYNSEKDEVVFSVPLKSGIMFTTSSQNSITSFTTYTVEVYTKKDI